MFLFVTAYLLCMLPLTHCVLVAMRPKRPINPCARSPCGPFSMCRLNNDLAVCSCQPNHIGSPPSCRPECMVSSECPLNQACVNQKCADPCPGTCGLNARCQVVNHNPICTCNPGLTGDPFTRCLMVESKHALSSATSLVFLFLMR
ncbi:keratin-associated protein 4-3-like [Nilaparvata lugens]|uniref:keratin-associated protein 4-3-like n=1 Tax=Nilaparvata lugens TaxID=108931 RepID=UPI00193E9A31|nr:keratin-associated protein 4-3-like [Nilaparvata lugens]